jgi:hypothetical protein
MHADWGWRRWLAVILLLFAAQIGMVWWLSAPPPAPRSLLHEPVVMALVDRHANERLLDSIAASDPALFALGSARGFSGAWIGFTPATPRPADWSEPDRYAGIDSNALGNAFRQYVQQNSSRPRVRPEKPVPAVAALQTPGHLFAAESVLTATGEIASRLPAAPVKLPAWPNAELLAPTTVQLLVNAEGMVLTARLLQSSGLAVADRLAMELAKGTQFQSVPVGRSASGNLIFNWKTVPPVVSGVPPSGNQR